MASVAPCDSASRSGSCLPSELLGAGRPLVEPPVGPFDGQSLVFGKLTVDQVRVYGDLMNRYYDSYNSYLLVSKDVSAAPVGAGSSSSFVSRSSGSSGLSTLSGSRARSARRAAAWRAKQSVAASYPEGFCYTRLFVGRARRSVALSLLSWPTLSSVLSQPADVASSLCLNEELRLVRTSAGYHVAEPADVPSGSRSWPLNDALVGLARRCEFPPASFGSDLKRAVRGSLSAEVLGLLSPDDLLGGTSRGSGPRMLLDRTLVGEGGASFSSEHAQFDAYALEFVISFSDGVSVAQSGDLVRAIARVVGVWASTGLEGSSVAWVFESNSVSVRLVFARSRDRDSCRSALSYLPLDSLGFGPYVSLVQTTGGSLCVMEGAKAPSAVLVTVGSYSGFPSVVSSLVQLSGVDSVSYHGSYSSEACTVVLHSSLEAAHGVRLGAAGVVAALPCGGSVRSAIFLCAAGLRC
jgi:hypothetical protein